MNRRNLTVEERFAGCLLGLTPDSYSETVGNAILLGGDTDAIAAMAGAISGAYLGVQAIPGHLLANLEDRKQGKTYIQQLAKNLLERYQKPRHGDRADKES
jgi:poly(ADP-ribose) glycohydrolase ARH3